MLKNPRLDDVSTVAWLWVLPILQLRTSSINLAAVPKSQMLKAAPLPEEKKTAGE